MTLTGVTHNVVSDIVAATGPEGEMTKEDVSEAVKGDELGWTSSHRRPVIYQVASAPMPSDCGESHPHILHDGKQCDSRVHFFTSRKTADVEGLMLKYL